MFILEIIWIFFTSSLKGMVQCVWLNFLSDENRKDYQPSGSSPEKWYPLQHFQGSYKMAGRGARKPSGDWKNVLGSASNIC